MYEVQRRSQIEMRKLDVQSEYNREQERNLTLYIEKSFQLQIDELTKEHLFRMAKVESDRDTVIHRIDSYGNPFIVRCHCHASPRMVS
jgi:hypothetical protein